MLSDLCWAWQTAPSSSRGVPQQLPSICYRTKNAELQCGAPHGCAIRVECHLSLVSPDGESQCCLSSSACQALTLLHCVHGLIPGVHAGIFFNLYTLFYMMSPRHCHAFVGYLEEEAVKTYTHCLNDIDSGKLDVWKNKKAPEIAINYWNLEKDATMRDVVLAVRCPHS